jgi:hypothetical protein
MALRHLTLALLCGHYVHRISGANVVAWPQIVRRSIHRQTIERDELGPSRFNGETATHSMAPLSPCGSYAFTEGTQDVAA